MKLGPLFDRPLHPAAWARNGADRGKPGFPRYDYRVTGDFNGTDLVNGGKHRATDVGNAGIGFAVLAPATCMARGRLHFDGAVGDEFQIGTDWNLQRWHLTKTLLTPVWRKVARGQLVGTTGNTGAKVNGQPMPAHTHIELRHKGVLVDAEPYLFGRELEGTNMTLPADVKPDSTHAGDIEWGINRGLFAKTDRFRPDDPLTRAQSATLMRRLIAEIERLVDAE